MLMARGPSQAAPDPPCMKLPGSAQQQSLSSRIGQWRPDSLIVSLFMYLTKLGGWPVMVLHGEVRYSDGHTLVSSALSCLSGICLVRGGATYHIVLRALAQKTIV